MKPASVLFAAILVSILSVNNVAMADQIPMQAKYMLYSHDAIIDPPENAKKDSVGIYIDGEAAWNIYYAMDVPAEKGADCQEGMLIKRAGAFVCYLSDTAHCELGVDLKSGKTLAASAC
jgi:hypothetical protein